MEDVMDEHLKYTLHELEECLESAGVDYNTTGPIIKMIVDLYYNWKQKTAGPNED